MKGINFDHINIDKPAAKPNQPTPRNQKEDLIEQIVAQCVHKKPGDDRKLARLLAVAANTASWTTTDLHALLRKRHDPGIRNYTGYVWWSAKVKKE